MIKFDKKDTNILIKYSADIGSSEWVWKSLTDEDKVRISNVFYFSKSDLLNPPTQDQELDDYEYRFIFGSLEDGYVNIPARVLDIQNDVLISTELKLKRNFFAAERNISIFSRLSNLLENSDPIVIGGGRKNAIPGRTFEELIKKFPNTFELDRYADARVHMILADYLDGMKDARGRYENYLSKKSALSVDTKLNLNALKSLEVEKYRLIRDEIQDALATKKDWSESDWQNLMLSFLLLIFPKYIKVLENVTVHDYYSNPTKKTDRYIDIALVDAIGNLDIIEVKKPFDDKILRRSLYRGNSIPTSELSGSIMQTEKYLFHLTKWGVKGEAALTKKYAEELPNGMRIRISNPKATVIVGRDQIGGAQMTGDQMLDFELIKRKYANIMDIITYDDLLRRLNNTIAALDGDPTTILKT